MQFNDPQHSAQPVTAALPKEQAREYYRRLRRELAPAQRRAETDALTAQLLPWLARHAPRRRVAAYLSYGAEPATEALLAGLHDAGFEVFVPICEPGRRLSWVRWSPGVAVVRSAVGPIMEPVGPRHAVELMNNVDVVLVPGQLIDAAGNRLGQGGGYYDRFITSLDAVARRPLLAALVYSHELVPAGSFEYGVLDRPVDAVLTAEGWTFFRTV